MCVSVRACILSQKLIALMLRLLSFFYSERTKIFIHSKTELYLFRKNQNELYRSLLQNEYTTENHESSAASPHAP